jgi:two-component system response regulator YesN
MASASRQNNLRLRRVLIVDDEKLVLLTLRDGLAKLTDCEIAAATDGKQALELFEQQPFDLLITDYGMPGMDGLALAARVRELYPRTAIIVITGYGSAALREQATHVPVQRILGKPVRIAEIRKAALEALDGPGSSREMAWPASPPDLTGSDTPTAHAPRTTERQER